MMYTLKVIHEEKIYASTPLPHNPLLAIEDIAAGYVRNNDIDVSVHFRRL